jgi:DNA-binding transcriptional ArsR family regulator
VHALDVLGDPTRRRILELLAGGELSAGEIVDVLTRELGITQSAVSQHLRVLRDHGFATARADGQRRLYSLEVVPLQAVDAWLERFRGFWDARLDALGLEIARGKRRRGGPAAPAAGPGAPDQEEPSGAPLRRGRSHRR